MPVELVLLLLINLGFIFYYIYTDIKIKKEKISIEKEQQRKFKEIQRKYWASLPEFYSSIPKENLHKLLETLENYNSLLKKYPSGRPITDLEIAPIEIYRLRFGYMDDMERYSDKCFLDFDYPELHIKFIKETLVADKQERRREDR